MSLSSDKSFVYSPSGENWLFDEYNQGLGLSFQISSILEHIKSEFQDIKVVYSPNLGKVLLLNNWIYRTEDQGYVMPEMIVHVPMNTGHFPKKKILLIGGGDGYSLHELIKYPEIEEIDMVEIDKNVVDVCSKYFPVANQSLKDKRVKVIIDDGFNFVKITKSKYDLILATGTEAYNAEGKPGISSNLFSDEFYDQCYNLLTKNGLFITDAQNGFYGKTVYKNILINLQKYFPTAYPYISLSKYIPGGFYVIIIASLTTNPKTDIRDCKLKNLSYYNKNIHKGSFSLPTLLI